ncbi:hypothetical protein TNIN_25701 [Trichonephila inaurata madagascariensis]|uniref:Uncharacterized protein n=1 Tax=Trichonephila inaurata madagascariensis TaxID=2747483 RepID=A0A8X7CA40_9ARAC|nr:hypothetical protein TNIN_25701 [Trichonephila inaurata madagascariensis]
MELLFDSGILCNELRNGAQCEKVTAKRTSFEYDHMSVQIPNVPQSVRHQSGEEFLTVFSWERLVATVFQTGQKILIGQIWLLFTSFNECSKRWIITLFGS